MDEFAISRSEAATLRAVANWVYFKTDFKLLKSHKGFRSGRTHLFLGTTGSGKSTLVRSILIDLFKNNPDKKALIILSEESTEDFKSALSETEFDFHSGVNMTVLSEEDQNFNSTQEYIQHLRLLISELKPNVLFFDNLTTSLLYNDKSNRDQFLIAKELKRLTAKHDIATIFVAHTGAQISDNMNRLINENDIRGSKSVVNMIEFLYIMQRFEVGSTFFQTIRVVKHRSQQPDHKLFRLMYDTKKNLYTSDFPLDFQAFKEAFNQRNKL